MRLVGFAVEKPLLKRLPEQPKPGRFVKAKKIVNLSPVPYRALYQ